MIRLYSGEQYESNSGNYLQHIRQTYTESTEVRNCHCLHATATALLDGSIWRRVCVFVLAMLVMLGVVRESIAPNATKTRRA